MDIASEWGSVALAVVVVLLLIAAARWLVLRAISRGAKTAIFLSKQRNKDRDGLAAERYEARATTLASLLRSVTNVIAGVLLVLTVLAIFDVPLGPLLTSAGVAGVALGIGAQSLVRDYLSGIFMIIEDQYGVGDFVDVGTVSGTVEDVGLRITRLRDGSGQIWYVRNGEIIRVGNQTQGWSTATIDIPVDPDENSAQVIDLLSGVLTEVQQDEQLAEVLIDEPQVVGVQSVEPGRMTIRMVAKTKPNQQAGVQRTILDKSLRALKDAGIQGPKSYPTYQSAEQQP